MLQGGKIKYSLVQKEREEKHFEIDDQSGTVRISSRLDYELKQLYNLTVKATDEGSPALSSLAYFVIEVIDVNENLHPPRYASN